MTLAPYVQILGRGPGRSRSLTRQEAEAAMKIMLSGQGSAEAVGAILMLLRMKGETAEEIAGFAAAARICRLALPAVDLDWPSYAAGRTRGLPWFLLSARLVARAGFKVLLHGWNGPDGSVRAELQELGIAAADNSTDAARAMARGNIVYVPLEVASPELMRLLDLRGVLGLRSCINTVARMVNPGRAPSCVQGVFHPSYRLLQADAAQLLGWSSLSVIKGGGGEFERHPLKQVSAFGLRNGSIWEASLPAQAGAARRLSDAPRERGALRALWEGDGEDAFATSIVLSTAALALDTLGVADAAAVSHALWAERRASKAA